ncbi:dienelactone hydrolase family protein [Mucilaginibacter ginkgonis]|uniref:Dienelactone hydrolase family protein n=1 Tax=Mucilaginibacter ginkgonis TaxID=2682091 RepID=A0A6I4HZL0_9SPHI|nr:dienelactone hydrolase family protein [Mucilaginibacter ginkgonis]QQL49405.1 dienelactone hydrolase family protein [Mucilaginibacter ginkgonis]
MKKLILLVAFMATTITSFSQSKMACCEKPTATKRFAMLASNKNFRMAHANPLRIKFQSSIGKSFMYKTSDGRMANAYELKAKKPTNNYLLVIHEWWGLNDFVKKESEKIYNDLGNVNVIDLDLYDGKVTDNRDEAGKLMQGVKEDRAKVIIEGAIAYCGPNAKIAILGWCFGGGWSLQTAMLAGGKATACVMYYGMPEQDINKLKTLHTDVLGNFAAKDQWINPKVVAQFEANMKAAGKKVTAFEYDADHGFSNPSNPIYNSSATQLAYGRTIAYLKTRVK